MKNDPGYVDELDFWPDNFPQEFPPLKKKITMLLVLNDGRTPFMKKLEVALAEGEAVALVYHIPDPTFMVALQNNRNRGKPVPIWEFTIKNQLDPTTYIYEFSGIIDN